MWREMQKPQYVKRSREQLSFWQNWGFTVTTKQVDLWSVKHNGNEHIPEENSTDSIDAANTKGAMCMNLGLPWNRSRSAELINTKKFRLRRLVAHITRITVRDAAEDWDGGYADALA
jgi:hypothetical protein